MSDSGRERPNCKHGHDSQCPHCAELATLRTQLAAAEARATMMEEALRVLDSIDWIEGYELTEANYQILGKALDAARAALSDAPQTMRSGEEMREAAAKVADAKTIFPVCGLNGPESLIANLARMRERIAADIRSIPITKEPADG